jgi:transcriptional regulator with XRE-family HTH domain
VDAVGKALLQRVLELLAARPEMSRADFGRRIGRGHSWVSEFCAGLRTTNDLRLLLKIGRAFRVSVGYLLGESERRLDPGAATLLATWEVLDPRDRELLLSVAATFRGRVAPSATEGAGSTAAPNDAHARRRARDGEPPKRKRSTER